jgi:hypothetical protein
MKLAWPLAVLMLSASAVSGAWYLDRDNSMSDANDDVGQAMAIVLGRNGTATQALQVCSGGYLSTAHGALDDPIKAEAAGRPLDHQESSACA